MAKKKIHKFKESTPEFFLILGLVSSANDYKLSWLINEKIKISLKQKKDYSLQTKKILKEFIYYSFEDDKDLIKLIANKCNKGVLINEFKNIDYFIKISGDNIMEKTKFIYSELKNNNNINGIFEIDLAKIKKSTKKIFIDI